MSRLRTAAKATVTVQIFNWASLLLSLVTVPLYLSWLGQERYGLLLTGLAFSSYLMFSDAGISWASMLLIARANGRDDRPGIASIVRTSFPLAACSALIVVLVIAGICLSLRMEAFTHWLPSHPEFPGLLLAIGSSVVFSLSLSPFYNLLIGLQETHLAAIYQGIGRLSGTLAAVGLAAGGASLGWVYGGNVAGALITGILAALHCVRRHKWAFQPGPMWDRTQIREQLRTGFRSFLMQMGNVFWGTAPVFAISLGAGPQFVPLFSIPMTLLNAPLGVFSSFSATLQPGYGEAMGRGELSWIADTVGRILRQGLVVIGLLSCGFLLLAGPFIHVWTGKLLEPGPLMLAGVITLASITTLMTVFRFALTGINCHRFASLSDLIGGAISVGLALVIARQAGFEWAVFSISGVALLTGAWILPLELKRALGGKSFWPGVGFFFRLVLTTTLSFGAGWLAVRHSSNLPEWITIALSGTIITIIFSSLIWWLLPGETVLLRRRFTQLPNNPA